MSFANQIRSAFRHCPKSLRTFLEKMNRGRVVQRRLSEVAAKRKIYFSPEGSLIWALPWATGDLDNHLNEFCSEYIKPGSVVWDFGAHFGLFSFTAAHFAGPQGFVLAVEPDPFLSNLIIKSEQRRPEKSAPVHALTAAISREAGFSQIEVPERSRAANSLTGKSECTVIGGVRSRFDVCVVTPDQLAQKFPEPDVVKMDIEGSELDALVGGEKTFLKKRPVMLLEVYANIQKDTSGLLKKWGYRLYDSEAPRHLRKELELAAHNTIAIPK